MCVAQKQLTCILNRLNCPIASVYVHALGGVPCACYVIPYNLLMIRDYESSPSSHICTVQ